MTWEKLKEPFNNLQQILLSLLSPQLLSLLNEAYSLFSKTFQRINHPLNYKLFLIFKKLLFNKLKI